MSRRLAYASRGGGFVAAVNINSELFYPGGDIARIPNAAVDYVIGNLKAGGVKSDRDVGIIRKYLNEVAQEVESLDKNVEIVEYDVATVGNTPSMNVSGVNLVNNLDWMRIGAFFFDSSEAFLTEKLICPSRLARNEKLEKVLQSLGSCVLSNIKNGIWIADLQLVRCPVCDQNMCDGTVHIVEVRHIELFLSEGYQDGSWDYEQIGRHDTIKHAEGASSGILDIKHLKDATTSGNFLMHACLTYKRGKI
ncbi:hypothetical protein AgCh_028353 [Apium graveolens]